MINLIIGNIFALVASIIMVYSGALKNQKKFIYLQTIQKGFSATSSLILGGFSGVVLNLVAMVRNILCYKDKLNQTIKIIIIIISIILTLIFNNLSFIGFLPLISTVAFICFMDIQDIKKFKILLITTTLLWLIYDLVIKSYTSVFFNAMTIIVNFVSLIHIKNNSVEKQNA